MLRRKITYRLYPKPMQAKALHEMLYLHQQLYNGLLEQRIWAYRAERKCLSFTEQCREITALRKEVPEFSNLSCHSMQVTAKRVHLGFHAFFRRVRKGEKRAGFPRFKSLQRFPGWGYKAHGNGFRFFEGEGQKNGTLRLLNIGDIKVRGRGRFEGTPKTCEILHKDGRWYASVTMVVGKDAIKRKRGRAKIGIDWGLSTFATIAHSGGKIEEIANPRHLAKAQKKLKAAQRQLSKKKRGSENRNKARKVVARLHGKVANCRHDFLHKTSSTLVAQSKVIITEQLSVKNMTGSAKGTKEKPGKMVKQKAGLNRNILDTAPGAFLAMLRYKAEEAGTKYAEVSTRKYAPTQTCWRCKKRQKKLLSQRTHACVCGIICGRDENAARVLIGLLGREPAHCGGVPLGIPMKQETPKPRIALAI
jgi:putative transposase